MLRAGGRRALRGDPGAQSCNSRGRRLPSILSAEQGRSALQACFGRQPHPSGMPALLHFNQCVIHSSRC
eukprot:1986834-Alexandrium_andersonii.AAC.1